MLNKFIFLILFFVAVSLQGQTIYYIDTVPNTNNKLYENELNKSKKVLSLIERGDFDAIYSLYDFKSGLYKKETLENNFRWVKGLLKKKNNERVVITLSKQTDTYGDESIVNSVNVYFIYPSKYEELNDKVGIKHYGDGIEFEFSKAKNKKKILNLLDKVEIK